MTDEPEDMRRDIKVYGADNRSHSILYHYGCYDPLQYPLLFPMGEPGWHAGIERIASIRSRNQPCLGQRLVVPIVGETADDVLYREDEVYRGGFKKCTNVSIREYVAYRCQMRGDNFNCILHAGRLGQQYIIDSYIKIETQRLDYYKMEQQQCDARTETLQGGVDSLGVDGLNDPTKIGYHIILPSSFIGGPRDMMKRYINAMNLV